MPILITPIVAYISSLCALAPSGLGFSFCTQCVHDLPYTEVKYVPLQLFLLFREYDISCILRESLGLEGLGQECVSFVLKLLDSLFFKVNFIDSPS